MKYSQLFFAVFFLLCSFSTQVSEIVSVLEIPKEEQEHIEKMLKYLIFDEGFAYTLFGSKPISTIAYEKNTPASYQELYPHPLFELESWWKTWEKYIPFFSLGDTIFLAQDSNEWFEIFLINKSNCLKVIEENLSLFREKMGRNLEADEVLAHIISSDSIFKEGLNKSQALFGILLGYGRENSVGFEKYFSKDQKQFFSFPKNSAEVQQIESQSIMVPCFSSFSKKETQKIVKKYVQERDRILKAYSQGDFLEVTLSKLMCLY